MLKQKSYGVKPEVSLVSTKIVNGCSFEFNLLGIGYFPRSQTKRNSFS